MESTIWFISQDFICNKLARIKIVKYQIDPVFAHACQDGRSKNLKEGIRNSCLLNFRNSYFRIKSFCGDCIFYEDQGF